MSFLNSFGDGDVWSMSGLTFTSPISDILEKDEFTLNELLEEPELLQEVKSKNEKLINFLESDESIYQLLTYTTIEAKEDDNDFRKFKYPYISCEIICFEIPTILNKIVDSPDEKFLKILFNPIFQDQKLNNYLAGYFEKMLEVLFRCKTANMMAYINNGGLTLLHRFLAHIDNYSIMQIIQRLLLPHIPFYADALTDDISDENRLKLQCLWSYDKSTCQALIDTMINCNNLVASMHVADLLITVVQLSPSDAQILNYLSDSSLIKSLCDVISNSSYEDNDIDPLFSLEVAIASVLECLISRIHETIISIYMNSNPSENDKYVNDKLLYNNLKDYIQSILRNIIVILPKINDSILYYLNESNLIITNQLKKPCKILRQKSFFYTKLIESLCRLDDIAVDDSLIGSGILFSIIKIFLAHQYHSMLHLSIQRIIIAILDDFINRKDICKYVLVDCNIFGMIQIELANTIDIPVSLRPPYIGHLLILALVIDGLIGAQNTDNNTNFDIESLESSTINNEIKKKSTFVQYFEEYLDFQSWELFSTNTLSKLSTVVTQPVNLDILDSPALDLGSNQRFGKQQTSTELGYENLEDLNDWSDEQMFDINNSYSGNTYKQSNNQDFSSDWREVLKNRLTYPASYNEDVNEFASFDNWTTQTSTEGLFVVDNLSKNLDIDDPFANNDGIKIDDLVFENK